MALLYRPIDPSRSYYGTDTRIGGLLLGCCLALVWHPAAGGGRPSGAHPVGVDRRLAGIVALVALCVLSTERARSSTAGLPAGGPGVAGGDRGHRPSGRALRPQLGIPLLVYLGVRSYSIYLWHWPVFALTRPGVDIHWGPVPVFILRVAITLVLADLSFRLVEAPIRSGAIGRWTACWRASEGEERSRRSRQAFLVGAVGVTSIVLLTAAIVGPNPRRPTSRRACGPVRSSWPARPRSASARSAVRQHGVAVGGGARHGGVRAGRERSHRSRRRPLSCCLPSPSSPSATRSCSARPPSCPRRSARARTSTPRSPPIHGRRRHCAGPEGPGPAGTGRRAAPRQQRADVGRDLPGRHGPARRRAAGGGGQRA